MMMRHAALLALAAAALCAGAASASDVITLTDENFEHDTQAATGATTGDWFVKFYAPWCGHCTAMQPAWEELASELQGQVNVAELDATEHAYTASRFGVRAFPTLLFLRGGRMYKYRGPRTAEALHEFALGGYAASEEGHEPVPPVMSSFDIVKRELVRGFEGIKGMYAKNPDTVALVFAAGLLIGVIVAMLLFCTFITPPSDYKREPAAAAQAQQAQQQQKKKKSGKAE